jgi:disulfide bond formation protein DsbB
MCIKQIILNNKIAWVALGLSGGALAFAYMSQYLWGSIPCELCLLQRYPYMVVIVVALLGLWQKQFAGVRNVIIIAGFMLTAGIAAYHVGVEQGLIDAPESCTAASAIGASLEELKAAILNAPKVSCKDVGASFAGISMAGWNMVYGIISAIIIGVLWRKQQQK